MQKSAAFLMVSVLLLGLFLASESRRPAAREIENAYADWVATNATRSAPQSHVVLVEINDSSLGGDNPWPWSPLPFALFLQGVLDFKPDVVAIEPILNWGDVSLTGNALLKEKQSAKILHDFVLQAPKIVLGSQLGFPADPDVVPQTQPVPLLRNIRGNTGSIPVFTDIEQQAQEDYRYSSTTGFVNIPARTAGEVTRKVPLVFNYRGEFVPSFVLQALIQWFKLTPDDVVLEPGSRIEMGKAASIPIDAAGNMNVDFNSPFTRFGFDDLLLAVEQRQEKQISTVPLDTMKGGIVLLARTDKSARTLLFPSRETGSPGELCARAIATVQNGTFSRRVSYVFDFAIIAIMMAASCFFHLVSKRKFLLVSFVVLIAYLLISIEAYSCALVWLPIILPAGLLLMANFFSLFSPRPAPGGK